MEQRDRFSDEYDFALIFVIGTFCVILSNSQLIKDIYGKAVGEPDVYFVEVPCFTARWVKDIMKNHPSIFLRISAINLSFSTSLLSFRLFLGIIDHINNPQTVHAMIKPGHGFDVPNDPIKTKLLII